MFEIQEKVEDEIIIFNTKNISNRGKVVSHEQI